MNKTYIHSLITNSIEKLLALSNMLVEREGEELKLYHFQHAREHIQDNIKKMVSEFNDVSGVSEDVADFVLYLQIHLRKYYDNLSSSFLRDELNNDTNQFLRIVQKIVNEGLPLKDITVGELSECILNEYSLNLKCAWKFFVLENKVDEKTKILELLK